MNSEFLLGISTNDRTRDIIPFSANVNCGSYTNTFTYRGVKIPSGNPLIYANDFIEIDPSSGQIKIAAAITVSSF